MTHSQTATITCGVAVGDALGPGDGTKNTMGNVFGQRFMTPDAINTKITAFALYVGNFNGLVDISRKQLQPFIYEWNAGTSKGAGSE